MVKLRHNYIIKPGQYHGFDLYHADRLVRHFGEKTKAEAFVKLLLGKDYE